VTAVIGGHHVPDDGADVSSCLSLQRLHHVLTGVHRQRRVELQVRHHGRVTVSGLGDVLAAHRRPCAGTTWYLGRVAVHSSGRSFFELRQVQHVLISRQR